MRLPKVGISLAMIFLLGARTGLGLATCCGVCANAGGGGGATKRLSSIKDALSSGKDLGSSGLGKSDIDGSAGGNGNSRTAESDEPGDDSESKPDSERLKTWGLSEQ